MIDNNGIMNTHVYTDVWTSSLRFTRVTGWVYVYSPVPNT